jgi:mannose-6-phosphate isomerase-like protein (cupin superfamily)
MTINKLNIFTSKKESNHLGAVDLVRLIKPNQIEGKVATMNYAWLEKDKFIEPHLHEDGSEFYLFIKGSGEMVIEGEKFKVKAGDFFEVSQGLMHSLNNQHKDTLEFITLRTIE